MSHSMHISSLKNKLLIFTTKSVHCLEIIFNKIMLVNVQIPIESWTTNMGTLNTLACYINNIAITNILSPNTSIVYSFKCKPTIC